MSTASVPTRHRPVLSVVIWTGPALLGCWTVLCTSHATSSSGLLFGVSYGSEADVVGLRHDVRKNPKSGRVVAHREGPKKGHNRKKRLALVHNGRSSACRCIPS